MRILIATPTYDGTVTIDYVNSLLGLHRTLSTIPGVSADIRFITSADVVHARNAFASILLQDPGLDNLLFVDADVGFRPDAVTRLIRLGEPLAGCFYPRRKLDSDRIFDTSRRLNNPAVAMSAAMEFLSAIDGTRSEKDPGFVRTRTIGAGLLLIHRSVLERIIERYPDLVARAPDTLYRAMGVTGAVYQCFERVQRDDGLYTSEDISFCSRWVDGCGGEIWGCTDEKVVHVGPFKFAGTIADRISYEALLQ